jgi:hypothetical protein
MTLPVYTLLKNEPSISMVVRKAFRRLFQLRHLSHGEHASDSDAILATTAKKINVTALVAWHCHQTRLAICCCGWPCMKGFYFIDD